MDISALAKDKSAKNFAKIHCGEYADDIFQEALLAMLELPKDKAKKIESDNATPFYFRQIIYNLSNRMYRPNGIADGRMITGIEIELEDNEKEIEVGDKGNNIESYIDRGYSNLKIHPEVVRRLNAMSMHDRETFLLYMEFGSFRKIEKLTGINYVSIHRTVKKVQDELRPILDRYL